MSTQGICWIHEEIVPLSEARISVMDHGLLYGDGVFEGIRFYAGKPLLLHEHLKRLEDSAAAIALPIPWPTEKLETITRQVIDAYGNTEGYIRVIITRGVGSLGINPVSCENPQLIVIADRLEMVADAARKTGIRTIISSTRRLPLDGLDPRIKSLNYLNHILAKTEANNAHVEEALMLNSQGHVTEGSADNVFIVRGGDIYTPPVSDGALDGITRGAVLRLGRELGLKTHENSLAPYDLYTSDECFLTGTGAELIPVREIDGRMIKKCPGPVYTKLLEAFRAYVSQ